MTNLILIGFKNSGKTSVGKLFAEKSNMMFIDTDDLITQEYYKKNRVLLNCREIVLKHGEDYFRDLEKKIISDLVCLDKDKNNTNNYIIATGGGCVLYPENVNKLKKLGKLVYLSISYPVLLERILRQPVLPSYLNPAEPEKSFAIIHKKLEPIFHNIADLEISTENKSISEITDELIAYVSQPRDHC